MFKAIKEVGGFKVGEIVPDEEAFIWLKMYEVPHVKKVSSAKESVEEEEKIEEIEEVEEVESDNSAMLDDYLARNENVVVKNLKKDNLSVEVLEDLMDLEKAGKNRKKVKKILELRIKEES